MSGQTMGIIEGVLVAAGLLGFALWQLWTVRDAGKDKSDADQDKEEG